LYEEESGEGVSDEGDVREGWGNLMYMP